MKKSPSHRSLSRLTNRTIWLDGNLKDILTSVEILPKINIFSAYFHNQLWSSPSSPRRVEGSLYFSQDKASHRILLGDSSGFLFSSPEKKVGELKLQFLLLILSSYGRHDCRGCHHRHDLLVFIVMVVLIVTVVIIVMILLIVIIAPCHR